MKKVCPVCHQIKSRPGTRWKNCSQECRDKSYVGKKHSPEHVAKMSKALKGMMLGHRVSKSTREKISKSLVGRFRGLQSPMWKGGRWIDEKGYVRIPTKPGTCEFVYEHRLVMEKMLGRKLTEKEVVHHKGIKYPVESKENKSDNRPENLMLFPNKLAHNKYHKELAHETF